MGFRDRLQHAWNAFVKTPAEVQEDNSSTLGPGYYGFMRPDQRRYRLANDRSIITAIITRIAIDAAAVAMYHARVDDNGQYIGQIASNLNACLTLGANIDQGARAFRQEMVSTLLEEGSIAIVPVDTTLDPYVTGSYDINTMRVGRVTAWFPQHVRVELYNEKIGQRQEVTLPKSVVAIAQNPLYEVMNEPNSTLQRLSRKLTLLDMVDENASSKQLDLIIQLPYVIKSEARKAQAEQRRMDIETQLRSSQYGIAYTDGTERITQLNRPVENNLLEQITNLTTTLYGQLGLTAEVMNGTATPEEMLNYYNRTIEPILAILTEAMKRTFLTATARTQGQSIVFIHNPFTLIAVTDIANMANSFARNEILTSNEIRGLIGFQPSTDPKADQLVNSNMPQGEQPPGIQQPNGPPQLTPVNPDQSSTADTQTQVA